MKNRTALVLLIALALIAVAGILFFAKIVLNPPPPPAELAPRIPAAEPYEAIVEKALAGYNARTAAALFADFAAGAMPPPTDATHRALFDGYYREAFGDYVNRKLIPRESQILPDRAVLVWDATFSKAKPVKLSANFVVEGGLPKIVQLRLEPPPAAE